MENNLKKNNQLIEEELITGAKLLENCFISSLKLLSNILKKIIKNSNKLKKIQKFLTILNILKNIESIINLLTTLDKNLIQLYLIIKKNKIAQDNIKIIKIIKIITLKALITIPSLKIKLINFLNILINTIKEDVSSFLYSDFIIIKEILIALNKSYKKLIDTNLKELNKIKE